MSAARSDDPDGPVAENGVLPLAELPWALTPAKGGNHAGLFPDIFAVYGLHFAAQALPLLTVPYLSRTLGPSAWGLLAMAQGFALYGNVLVDYGFLYSGTRQIAAAESAGEIEKTVAGVSAAKVLLSGAAVLAACAVYYVVPVFRQQPLLLWAAVLSEIVKALLPTYFFYGMHRVATASLFDMGSRLAATAGIFLFVHRPQDAWKVFALNGISALFSLIATHWLIYRSYAARVPHFSEGWQMLRQGWAMFLFRSAHNIYSLGNAFIFGVFAAPRVVGYYAGAEKINSAAVGLLSPLTTVLYPRVTTLAKTSPARAARLTAISGCIIGALSLILTAVMFSCSSTIVSLILGNSYALSSGVFRILSFRAPLAAVTNILGFQWLLVLGLEKQFQQITLAALLATVALAVFLAPAYGARGMAWSVLLSQAAAALGIYVLVQRRGINPFAAHRPNA